MYRWTDDGHLEVDDTSFFLMGEASGGGDDQFSLYKPRFLVEEYLNRADLFRGARVFEAGIFRGGSTAFLATLLDPEKLVAIDISPDRNKWLDEWLEERGQTDKVRLYHGVDQSDRGAIDAILGEEFGDAPLDLVIDDASHKLSPTVNTFNALFPRLRTGGLYIIEDWSDHLTWYRVFMSRPDLLARALQARPALLRAKMLEEPELVAAMLEKYPEVAASAAEAAADESVPDEPELPPNHGMEKQMWRLILRLVVASGGYRELVTDIHIQKDFAALHRGPVDLDPASFDLDDWLLQSAV